MSTKRFIVRCRKCWENVAVVVGDQTKLENCPLCKKPETYRHAMMIGKGKKAKKVGDYDYEEVAI